MHGESFRYKSYRIVIAAFLTIAVLMGVLCFQYYRTLQVTIRAESREYLTEIAKQVSGNSSRNINDNFAVLGTISRVLKSTGVRTYKELQPEVQAQQSFWNYKDILLIDGRGNAYDAQGNIVLLNGDEYLREAVVNRRRTLSPAQVINGSECIVFVMPIEGLIINNTEMFALAATYDLATLDNILSISAFSGRGYAYIIQKNGSVVVRPSSEFAPQSGYNILTSLSSAEMDESKTLNSIKSDIIAGKTDVASYTQHGTRMYVTYTPMSTNGWYLLGFVPVEVVNEKSDLLMTITLLLCAGITFAFAMLVAYQMFVDSRHKNKLEQIAYVDPITGGNTMGRFYEVAGELLKKSNRIQYALVYINIEKFKLLNEEFGPRACDDLLRSLHNGIEMNLSRKESMGRLFADNFCALILLKDEENMIRRFRTWYEAAASCHEEMNGVWLAPIMEFGVYIIGNDSLPFAHMIDRAKLALKGNPAELLDKLRCAVYDDAIRKRLFREKHLENMMTSSLQNEEFTVYLQPKYRTGDETIGGAEALVRWNSAEGMIYPDEFISLFEKNGFITQLDLWVFEDVCKRIRQWLDAGIAPVKISVNCSRVHLKNPKFLTRYTDICTRYNVPPEYLEIELTENVVFENVSLLSTIIDSIHSAGFGCAMDDFGSGYSSLNLIQDIPVDTLKLDKVFFRNGTKDLNRTESVVGSILTMSRSLNMNTVAEGVEERGQVDMLKRLGCDYIQGFFFARPMPVSDFELLAYGRSLQSGLKNGLQSDLVNLVKDESEASLQ